MKQKRAFTFLEVILVMAMLALLTTGTWLVLKTFWIGRSLETSAENLVHLIRTAQASAKETESCQMILFTETSAIWLRYPGKTKEYIESRLFSEQGDMVRRQEFKNEVIIEELELESGSAAVPDEPITNIGILIDERGYAESATIVLAKGKETAVVSAGGSIVSAGGETVGVLDSAVVAQFIEQVESGEEALIVQTEPLQARGWQVITINNVDTVSESPAGISKQGKVKEVKLRVKLDSRLPASAHIHAYVFPGWYENKPVAHGVTGQQTMLNKMGTVPSLSTRFARDNSHCHFFPRFARDFACASLALLLKHCSAFEGSAKITYSLYRETTNDCLAFFAGTTYTISGTLTNEEGKPIERIIVESDPSRNSGQTDENGAYSIPESTRNPITAVFLTAGQTIVSSPVRYSYGNTTLNQTANFIGYRNIICTINVFTKENNGVPINNARINVEHIPLDYNNYGITIATDNTERNYFPETKENGFSSIPILSDHYYSVKPIKQGYIFQPESVNLFLDSNKTQDFIGTPITTDNPFSSEKIPLGNWSYSESQISSSAVSSSVPVFGNITGYYIYKNKIENITQPFRYHNATQSVSYWKLNEMEFNPELEVMEDNKLNPGGLSDFATKEAYLYYEEQMNYANAHWREGFAQSSFASQREHVLNTSDKEISAGNYSEWLAIPVSSLPSQTKFLRIALAIYHETPTGEQLFNLYPTISSTHFNEQIFTRADYLGNSQSVIHDSQSSIDYETDPFIVYYPWTSYINNPFWLSHYAYAVKPMLRPYGVNVLANKGPITGENYRNRGTPYQGFWYGPLYLDWDLILGNENIYWLLCWLTGTFELTKWRYEQLGDTYGNTTLAPPSYYLLKNFAYLSYWYLFQYSEYYPTDKELPKRFQEPLNLASMGSMTAVSEWLKLFERPDPSTFLLPRESSSLSMPFLQTPIYPVWLPDLPAIFGQGKLISAPDLYSSYYYLQERINHTMLDIGMWAWIEDLPQKDIAIKNIFGYDSMMGQASFLPSPTLGNLERFIRGEASSSWWNWYSAIPWAKGQAFPKKTGPLPTDISERTGWEKPVITQPSSYWSYFSSTLIFRDNPTTSYNALQVVNAPHTIFMSTSHYPLGTIQTAVKK